MGGPPGPAPPTPGGGALAWAPGAGLVPAGDGDPPLLAADSWLVDAGRARGLALHRRRFAAACAQAGGPCPGEFAGFWAAALARLPAAGRWFPRVELVDAGRPELRLRVRPAPPVTGEARVWVAPPGDPRLLPRRKGPDLHRLATLRREAERAGAGEALLRTESGVLLEGANATLLWWEGTALCTPGPDLPVLDGVTAALVLARARASGIEVRRRRAVLAELAGCEAWLTNALHGIRPVTAWIGADVAPGAGERAVEWRAWLRRQTEPLAVGVRA